MLHVILGRTDFIKNRFLKIQSVTSVFGKMGKNLVLFSREGRRDPSLIATGITHLY